MVVGSFLFSSVFGDLQNPFSRFFFLDSGFPFYGFYLSSWGHDGLVPTVKVNCYASLPVWVVDPDLFLGRYVSTNFSSCLRPFS